MKQPPKWIDRVLEYLLRDRFVDEVLGDLHEWYEWKQGVYSRPKLVRAYWWNAFRAIRLHQMKNVKNLLINLTDMTMINNNIKIGLRSLLQSRFFTAINVLGLTVSLVSFLLIFAFIRYERSYNTSHPKADEIYRVLRKNVATGLRERPIGTPLANAFLQDFEGAIEFARFGQDGIYVELGEKKFYEADFYWSDPSVFHVFDLPFVYGNPQKALQDKNTLVVTRAISEKYFGEGVNPVGKSLPIKIYDSNVDLLMRIDGVIEDLPGNSDLPFKLLGSMSNALELYSQFNEYWGFFWLHAYAHIPDKNDLPRLKARAPMILEEAIGKEYAANRTYDFQPLSEVHLYSEDIDKSMTDGSIRQVRVLSLIALFILLIASINYLSLVSARLTRRKQEVGIRRVMGARGSQIMGQLFTESALTIFVSFLLATGLTGAIWPLFTDTIGKEIPMAILWDRQAVLWLVSVVLGCTLLSGLYPAWMASKIRSKGLVDKQASVKGKRLLQKGLVTFQFAIAVFLVTSSVLIFRQVRYVSQKDLGFDQSHLVSIKLEDRALQDKIDVIKEAMAQVNGVTMSTASGEALPSALNSGAEMFWGPSDEIHHFVKIVAIDERYFETLQVDMVDGQAFTATSDASMDAPIIVNEAAFHLLEVASHRDIKVRLDGHQRTIMGVVKDYHVESLKNKVQPTVFVYGRPGSRQSPDNIILRLSGDHIAETLGEVEDIWYGFSSSEIFDLHFVDQSFALLYESDQRFLRLFTGFSILSIFIACLGLYGVVVFTTEEKSKEISIRKVLGSTVAQVTLLVSRRFLILVVLGLLMGFPGALYFIREWLAQFSYRLEPEPAFIILAVVIVGILAAVTIGVHTIRAALANPVKYLRNE